MDIELKDNLKSSYNLNAHVRDKSSIDGWKLNELNRFISHFKTTEGLKLLDVGAGSGQHVEYLQSRGFSVHGIDRSEEMVSLCQKRNVTASVMDFYHIDFPENTFDAVWSMNALLHVPKKSLPHVLAGIRKVLKPGGIFYLGVYGGYNSEGIWEEDSYEPKRFFSFFTHEDIQKEIEKVFDIVDFNVLDMPAMTMDFQSMILK